MDPASPQDVTQLLQAWSRGEESALDKLVPSSTATSTCGPPLHGRRARRALAADDGPHSRGLPAPRRPLPVAWESRGHFFAVAARVMRRILVDHARARRSLKRGGKGGPVSLDEELLVAAEPDRDLVSLDDALQALATFDERKAHVVEMRFFGGLSVEETAQVLGVSPQTILRDWKLAKVWLLREMKRGESVPPRSEETP